MRRKIMLAIASDYLSDQEKPEITLKNISNAGFKYVHWCHQWNSDYIYPKKEVKKIGQLLNQFNLKLNDLHATEGNKGKWYSLNENERKLGVRLVKNRMLMSYQLQSKVIVLHPYYSHKKNENEFYFTQAIKSLKELKKLSKKLGVKIALENLYDHINIFDNIEKLFENFNKDYLGICYDSGHGNITKGGLSRLELLKERLIALHLHDNNGKNDQHKLLFSGTVDWEKLAKIISEAKNFNRILTMEVSMKEMKIYNDFLFLNKAFETGTKFYQMIYGNH